MIKLSKGHTLRNYFDVKEFELDRFVYWLKGQDYNLLEKIRGKGITHMFGDWTIKKDGEDAIKNNIIDNKIIDELNKIFESKRGFDIFKKKEFIDIFQNSEWEKELSSEIDQI